MPRTHTTVGTPVTGGGGAGGGTSSGGGSFTTGGQSLVVAGSFAQTVNADGTTTRIYPCTPCKCGGSSAACTQACGPFTAPGGNQWFNYYSTSYNVVFGNVTDGSCTTCSQFNGEFTLAAVGYGCGVNSSSVGQCCWSNFGPIINCSGVAEQTYVQLIYPDLALSDNVIVQVLAFNPDGATTRTLAQYGCVWNDFDPTGASYFNLLGSTPDCSNWPAAILVTAPFPTGNCCCTCCPQNYICSLAPSSYACTYRIVNLTGAFTSGANCNCNVFSYGIPALTLGPRDCSWIGVWRASDGNHMPCCSQATFGGSPITMQLQQNGAALQALITFQMAYGGAPDSYASNLLDCSSACGEVFYSCPNFDPMLSGGVGEGIPPGLGNTFTLNNDISGCGTVPSSFQVIAVSSQLTQGVLGTDDCHQRSGAPTDTYCYVNANEDNFKTACSSGPDNVFAVIQTLGGCCMAPSSITVRLPWRAGNYGGPTGVDLDRGAPIYPFSGYSNVDTLAPILACKECVPLPGPFQPSPLNIVGQVDCLTFCLGSGSGWAGLIFWLYPCGTPTEARCNTDAIANVPWTLSITYVYCNSTSIIYVPWLPPIDIGTGPGINFGPFLLDILPTPGIPDNCGQILLTITD